MGDVTWFCVLCLLAIMITGNEAGDKTKMHHYRLEATGQTHGAAKYGEQGCLYVQVIMDYGTSPWFTIDVPFGTFLKVNKPVPYDDQSKELYGVLRGFLFKYKRGEFWPETWTVFSMRVGTSTYSDYPNEVPACMFKGGVEMVQFTTIVGCMYDRNAKDKAHWDRVEKAVTGVKMYKSLDNYKDWEYGK